jgi:oligoendopeptidase F
VLNGESGAVEKYLCFLKSGGSKFPLDTLRLAGVDMATPEPIESTLRLFERRVNELESLLG